MTFGFSSNAFAVCTHPPIPLAYGSAMNSEWRITDGSSCGSTSNHPEWIGDIVIAAKPSHGVAGRAGKDGVAYQPAPGFKGTDRFVYVVTSNSNWRGGAGQRATVNVTVVSE